MEKGGFGGFSFMSLNLDDFSGTGCQQKTYPLLSAATRALVKHPATFSSSRADPSFLTAQWRDRAVDSAPRKRKKRSVYLYRNALFSIRKEKSSLIKHCLLFHAIRVTFVMLSHSYLYDI